MTFNNREITKELFFLDDSNLNPSGLYAYDLNIGRNLGVEYLVWETLNNEPYEGANYWPDEKEVSISSMFFNEDLTEKEYKVTKGIIDHETGHVLWLDRSYLFDDSESNKEHGAIWDFGNLIDDIRIERRMVNEFHVDKNNFKHMIEGKFNNFNESKINDAFFDIGQMVTFATNITYRKTIIPFYGEGNVSKWSLFTDEIKPMIDRFLESNEGAVDTAKEIICLIKKSMQKK